MKCWGVETVFVIEIQHADITNTVTVSQSSRVTELLQRFDLAKSSPWRFFFITVKIYLHRSVDADRLAWLEQ